MLKKGLLLTLLALFFVGCAGTVRLAEKENSATQTRVTKPTQPELNHSSQKQPTQIKN